LQVWNIPCQAVIAWGCKLEHAEVRQMEAAPPSNHLSVGTQLKLQYAARNAQLQLLEWRTILPLPGDGPLHLEGRLLRISIGP
jgi:hypothetical protein